MSVANVQPAAESDLAISDREFSQFRDFLYDRSGLYFNETKRFLAESRLRRRIAATGTHSVSEYLALLRAPVKGQTELLELLDSVTTHETSFFRHQTQLEAFRRRVLPEIFRRQEGRWRRSLRVWSAACSSGEEPYTLAMLLLEVLGAEITRWNVQILGTDIARSVLEKACAGLYSRYSFRGTPAYYIQKYFEVEGPDAFRLRDEPKRLVEFRLLNFADEPRMRAMGGFHVVFCRNALIYFDKAAKRRFVAHFFSALEPGGYFFAGHSESLHGISEDFKLIHFPGALAYQKPGTRADGSSSS